MLLFINSTYSNKRTSQLEYPALSETKYNDMLYLIYSFTDLGGHGVYLTTLAKDDGKSLYQYHVDECSNALAARPLESCEVLKDRIQLLDFFNSASMQSYIGRMITDCTFAKPAQNEVYVCENVVALAGIMDDLHYASIEPLFTKADIMLDKFAGYHWNWSCDSIVHKRMNKAMSQYKAHYRCTQEDLNKETRLDKFRSLLYPPLASRLQND